MYPIQHLPGRTARIDGEEWLYFSGTAYLGVVRDERFQALVREGIDRYGVHYGGSRLASIHLPVFEEAEALLCQLTGAPAALIVSSGTLAGQFAVRVLGQDSRCSFAPGVHPALWTEGYAPFTGAYEEWVEEVKSEYGLLPLAGRVHAEEETEGKSMQADRQTGRPADGQTGRPADGQTGRSERSDDPENRYGQAGRPAGRQTAGQQGNNLLLLTNSLDSLHAQPYNFTWLRELPADRPITVVVDDSHGLGVTGADGAGIFPQLNTPANVEVIVISSLGKALGIPGGVILGSVAVMERIRQSPYFGGASPTPPAFLHALVEGQHLYAENRLRLRQRVRQFREAVGGSGLFQSFGEYPVFYTPDQGLADFLAARRILVSSFSYPTPNDSRVTRVVINALHTEADVETLSERVKEYEATLYKDA